MRYKKALSSVIIFFVIAVVNCCYKIPKVFAEPADCSTFGIRATKESLSRNHIEGQDHTFIVNFAGFQGDTTHTQYKIETAQTRIGMVWNNLCEGASGASVVDNIATLTCKEHPLLLDEGVRHAYLYEKGSKIAICYLGEYGVRSNLSCQNIEVFQKRQNADGETVECFANGCLDNKHELHVRGDVLQNGVGYTGLINVELDGGGFHDDNTNVITYNGRFNSDHSYIGAGIGVSKIFIEKRFAPWQNFCEIDDIVIGSSCNVDSCQLVAGDLREEWETEDFDICNQIIDGTLREKCYTCQDSGGLWTAFGCIPTNLNSIISAVVTIGLMSSGGIALLMILISGFLLSISQGNPEQVGKARDLLVSAVTGLLFVIFSTTILQFIGHDILRIPGFGN